MKAKYVGDPRYRDEPAKANDHQGMTMYGVTFPKGKAVTLDDDWAEKHGDKLRNNDHFEVDGKPAAPGMETYKAPKGKKNDDEEPDTLVHHPDDGSAALDTGAPATPQPEAMVKGLESVDSPTQTPSRQGEAKRKNLERDL